MNEMSKTETAAVASASPAPAATSPIAPEVSGSLAGAFGAGLIAAALGAVLWAVITVATHMQIGFMAVGVGFVVAWAVRRFGRGTQVAYGVLGGGLALLGCVAGNLLSACGLFANAQERHLSEVLALVAGNPALGMRLMQATFHETDLLFYAIAVYEGYKLARLPAPR